MLVSLVFYMFSFMCRTSMQRMEMGEDKLGAGIATAKIA